MAAISVPNVLVNGTAADATAVNANFDALTDGLSDGTSDVTISALTCNGAVLLNGDVTLGNATGDDIVVTGRIAADIDPKTASTYDLGDATQLWKGVYCDDVFASRGATGAPSHSFSVDTDTGMYSSGAGILDFTTQGTTCLSISAAQVVTFLNAPVFTAVTASQCLEVDSSKQLQSVAITGTGSYTKANGATLIAPVLGTPSSGNLSSCSDYPMTSLTGLGTNVSTWLATPSSANLAAAVTDETGTGSLVFANTPTLVTPALGTPGSGVLTSCTGLPMTTGVTGTLPVANGGTGSTTASTGTGGVVLAVAPALTGATTATSTGAVKAIEVAGDHATEYVAVIKNTVASAGAGANILLLHYSADDTLPAEASFIHFNDADSSEGRIKMDGGGTDVVYQTTSDLRLKENFRPIENSLGRIMECNPTRYTYKKNGRVSEGFVAQELHNVFPAAVTIGGEDVKKEPWMVDYGRITPLLTAALQELTKKVSTLEDTIKNMQG